MNPKISISRSGPGAAQLRARLESLSKSDVLVGIPQKTTQRRKQAINNASLLYIHTHGSPGRNIPARPVIEPAIAADGNRQIIATELADAAKAHLQGDDTQTQNHLDRAGIAGTNASKSWFTDARNNWAPNAPSTIKRKGSDRPLIDTGTLRRSLTYVVRVQP